MRYVYLLFHRENIFIRFTNLKNEFFRNFKNKTQDCESGLLHDFFFHSNSKIKTNFLSVIF